jgi:hypothetical protein
VRESTKTDQITKARRILQAREGRVAAGLPVLPRADKIVYDEVAADLRQHYATTGSRNLGEAEGRFKHLDQAFTGRRIAGIAQADVTAYAARRQAKGAANATVNREIAVLGRTLKLAFEGNKLLRLPTFHKLKERGPREGFFEREQFVAVRRHLPHDLKVAVTIMHTFGWRSRSDVLALERRHVDLTAGTLRLEASMTKTDEARAWSISPASCARCSPRTWRASRRSSARWSA